MAPNRPRNDPKLTEIDPHTRLPYNLAPRGVESGFFGQKLTFSRPPPGEPANPSGISNTKFSCLAGFRGGAPPPGRGGVPWGVERGSRRGSEGVETPNFGEICQFTEKDRLTRGIGFFGSPRAA